MLVQAEAIAAWNSRSEPIGNPDELPEWLKDAIENEILGHIALMKSNNGVRYVINESKVKALEWVLSLHKPGSE